ncbi:hypothetical protein ACFV4M_23765 [Kitasatospora indigofera]|uniref:hypothetical protein n=1 Tax=Kitasatospora indigofera TaxID=67307 RepID=UPI00366286E4
MHDGHDHGAVGPALVDAAERALHGVGALRMRWIEHALRAEAEVVVDGTLSVAAAHRVAEAAGRAVVGRCPGCSGPPCRLTTSRSPEQS